MHVCESESADILRRPLRLISSPALGRVWQNGEQFLIIDGVRHKNRLVLGVHRANPKTDEQCQRKESRTWSRATLLPTNESRWFHASALRAIQVDRTRLTLTIPVVKNLA